MAGMTGSIVELNFGNNPTSSYLSRKYGIKREQSIPHLPVPTCSGGIICIQQRIILSRPVLTTWQMVARSRIVILIPLISETNCKKNWVNLLSFNFGVPVQI